MDRLSIGLRIRASDGQSRETTVPSLPRAARGAARLRLSTWLLLASVQQEDREQLLDGAAYALRMYVLCMYMHTVL